MASHAEQIPSLVRIDAAAVVRRVRSHLAERAETGTLASFLRRIRNRSSMTPGLPLIEDAETRRFLARLGALDSHRPTARTAQQLARFVEEAARAGAQEPAVIGVLLRAFASGLYGVAPEPVCGDAPRCGVCPLASSCAEHNRRPRPESTFGPGQDPSERLWSEGACALSTDELMCVLASSGARSRSTRTLEACRELLKSVGGLRGVARQDVAELGSSLPKRGAGAIAAAMELAKRWALEPKATGKDFRTGADFYNHYKLRLRDLNKEVFIAVILDQKSRFLADEQCSEGTLTASLVHPREAFRRAILESAASVAFVHNHPSGNPQPSKQDLELTSRLVEVATIVGIRLVDHVIIGDCSFFSFGERGLLGH